MAVVSKMALEGHSDSALLLDAALENIPYGFCVWSSEFKLVMWNRHYLELYSFAPHRVTKGMTLEDVVKLSAELGNHPDQTPQQFLAAYKKQLRNNRSGLRHKSRELLSGGRTIETAHIFSPGLGWVVTHEDVTEEIASSEIVQRRKRELERQNIRLDAAVNNISQGLCMFDPSGRLMVAASIKPISKSGTARIVRCAPKPSLRDASCCSVEVVNGAAGWRLRCFFSTLLTVSAPPAAANSASRTACARCRSAMSN